MGLSQGQGDLASNFLGGLSEDQGLLALGDRAPGISEIRKVKIGNTDCASAEPAYG